MEKVVFYRVWFFDDMRENQRYYFEDKSSCEMARFCVYKRYDAERISKRNFVVPVTQVKSMLVNECDLDKINIQESWNVEEREPEI